MWHSVASVQQTKENVGGKRKINKRKEWKEKGLPWRLVKQEPFAVALCFSLFTFL